jgi:lysophospholipase L1-like esterase
MSTRPHPHFMKSFILTICALFFAVSPVAANEVLAPAAERIVLVGDSTTASGTGWGDSFAKLLNPGVECINLGRGGRSSKSYRDEGWWEKALAEKPTWVFIQFGHNDQPGKGPKRETDPETSFSDNLERYVKEAREAGAKPVLITSLTRRNFNAQGKIDPQKLETATDGNGEKRTDNLNEYAAATVTVAKKLKVPLIDLNALSVAQMNRLGPVAARKFDPSVGKDQAPDKTHLSKHGAEETGKLVAAEVRRVIPEFAGYFSK